METRENNFKVQRNCAKRIKFHHQFDFTSTFKCFIWTSKFVFEIWCCQKWFLLRRYLKQSRRSLQYNVNYLGTKILSTLSTYSNFWWIPSQNNLIPVISMPASGHLTWKMGVLNLSAAATLQGWLWFNSHHSLNNNNKKMSPQNISLAMYPLRTYFCKGAI